MFTSLSLVDADAFDPYYTDVEEIVIVYGFDYYFCIFLVNVLSFLYLVLKFYRLLCYAKLTLDWLPIINPYNFPLSYLSAVTRPYFKFWSGVLPNLKLEKSSFEISAIVGLECINAILYLSVRIVSVAIVHLEMIEQQAQIILENSY